MLAPPSPVNDRKVSMLPAITAALKGLAALPKLVEAVNDLGERLNRVAANERLSEKKKRNRAAIAAILNDRMRRDEAGQRGEPHRPR